MRLFLVGFPKSGTCTLQNSLSSSGLTSVHWQHTESKSFVGQVIYRNIMAAKDPFFDLSGIDAITQADVCLPDRNLNYWPQLDISTLLLIRKHHPSCYFLLNWRCPKHTARSMSRWGDLTHQLTVSDIPGLPRGYGGSPEHLILWMENHFHALRTVFRDDPKFIEVDMSSSDAPERIGQALGIELVTWEYKNVTAQIEKRRAHSYLLNPIRRIRRGLQRRNE